LELIGSLNARQHAIIGEAKDVKKNYLSPRTEQEAWVIGTQARQAARVEIVPEAAPAAADEAVKTSEANPPRIGDSPEIKPMRVEEPRISLSVKSGDSINYQGKRWSVDGYNGETGDVVLVRDAQRSVASERLAELNPGRPLEVGGRYTIRRSSGAIEEGWRLEGTNPDGSILMYKEGALRVEVPRADIADANPQLVHREVPPQTRLERKDVAVERVPAQPGELDSEQIALRDNEVYLNLGKRKPGMGGHDMTMGRVEHPDGSYQKIVFHQIHDTGDGRSFSAARLRKEMAAYQLNGMLGFDNGFPVTVPREVVLNGKPAKGWMQDMSGETFEGAIRDLAKQRYGGRGSSEDVSRLIKEDPELRRQVEQAFAERLIYGDWDNHALNYVIVETPTGPKVQSIDLDHAFSSAREPQWITQASQGVNRRLHADFSEQPLSETTLGNIGNFVENYDTPLGRQQLAALGLKPDEIDGVLSRARWLAEKGEFPKAYTHREYLAHRQAQLEAERAAPKPGRVRAFFKRLFGD
jgi:hypothetical protein